MKLPHQNADIASEGFQRLEDLATAYWYSEVLFAALELNIFGLLGAGPAAVPELAASSGYDDDGLGRLLASLVALGLLVEHEGRFSNGSLAARYLVPGRGAYLGDFLRYRRLLTAHWPRLAARIRQGVRANDRVPEEPPEVYQERTLAYVRAMDLQARLKAAEALDYLAEMCQPPPRRLLDLGGGAGAWCRAWRGPWPQVQAVLLDLPETLAAARKLYPDPQSWQGIAAVAGNALTPCLRGQNFDLVLLSNFLHAYGAAEAGEILQHCVSCLAPGGMVLIHDYLADLHDTDPIKGSLYDLHMLINTYNGRIYRLEELVAMLEAAGLSNVQFFHLPSDTSILLARRDGPPGAWPLTRRALLPAQARRLGFPFARLIETSAIALEPWVRLKCQFGCAQYGHSLVCPPYSPDEEKMRAILSRYRQALLVQGTPPAQQFHENLLALERTLYLAGHSEALAFGAGPCPVCPQCPANGRCLHPDKARPAMEACGVDVYETACRAGLPLNPVPHARGYVKYVGLVLFN
jgi:predicted metal-binding protein/ubiquinone/menaquinone biosynthesis C-methylase UbiE